jgi:DNA-binding NarL/FixJ family response regulator
MDDNQHKNSILVAIVEDYDLLRQKYAKLIRAQDDLTCILQTSSIGNYFVEVDLDLLPDVLLLDIQLGDRNSIQYIEQIRQIHPGIKIIIITGYNSPDYILSALNMGINAYFIKGDDTRKLVDVIRTVYHGGQYFSPEVAGILPESYLNSPLPGPTKQETGFN